MILLIAKERVLEGGLDMNKKKLFFAIICALGSGMVGFFANQLSEIYGCILFGVGVALMVYSIFNLSK